jgi:hypothetical protein
LFETTLTLGQHLPAPLLVLPVSLELEEVKLVCRDTGRKGSNSMAESHVIAAWRLLSDINSLETPQRWVYMAALTTQLASVELLNRMKEVMD